MLMVFVRIAPHICRSHRTHASGWFISLNLSNMSIQLVVISTISRTHRPEPSRFDRVSRVVLYAVNVHLLMRSRMITKITSSPARR